MVRTTSYSVALTFKYQFTAVLLLRPLVVAGRILWYRFCPSFPPDICLGVSLDLDHQISLSWHYTRNSYEVVHNNLILWKNCFCPKNKNVQSKGFLNSKKNLVTNFHCILYWKLLFAVFLHKSSIWEKSYSWDIGQNPLSQSDCRISKWTISPEQIDETVSFLACWYGQSGCWTLKLN